MERTRHHSISSKFDVSFQVAMRMFATAGNVGRKADIDLAQFSRGETQFRVPRKPPQGRRTDWSAIEKSNTPSLEARSLALTNL